MKNEKTLNTNANSIIPDAKQPLIRLEYGRNYSTANKISDENVVYAPKNYLILHATRRNHITIKLSPSEMALYCYIQGYKDYGISKAHLVTDINNKHSRYRKFCTLFCASHSDYDTDRIKVVVSQINSKVRMSLVGGNHSSFDFVPWTERISIKSTDRFLYYIGISDVRFKPVIVDDNRRFVESPYSFIDGL